MRIFVGVFKYDICIGKEGSDCKKSKFLLFCLIFIFGFEDTIKNVKQGT